RSPKLIAAIVCLDLVAVGLLVYALTRPSGHSQTNATPVAQTQRTVSEHAQTSSTPATTTTATTTHARRHHHHRHLAPATVMTRPSQSRAPKVSAKAKARAQSSGATLDTDSRSGGEALRPDARAS